MFLKSLELINNLINASLWLDAVVKKLNDPLDIVSI